MATSISRSDSDSSNRAPSGGSAPSNSTDDSSDSTDASSSDNISSHDDVDPSSDRDGDDGPSSHKAENETEPGRRANGKRKRVNMEDRSERAQDDHEDGDSDPSSDEVDKTKKVTGNRKDHLTSEKAVDAQGGGVPSASCGVYPNAAVHGIVLPQSHRMGKGESRNVCRHHFNRR